MIAFPNSVQIYAVLFVTIFLVGGGIGLYYLGGKNASGKQAIAQIKFEKKIRKTDAKIAKGVPINGDDAAIDGFLLSHTGK